MRYLPIQDAIKTNCSLSLKEFDFEVPDSLVAQEPLERRELSRLLFREKTGEIQHRNFVDLPEILSTNKPLIVRNNSKVLHARLIGKTETGAKVELFLLSSERPDSLGFPRWNAIGKPLRKLKEGREIIFSNDLRATVLQNKQDEQREGVQPIVVSFNLEGEALLKEIGTQGFVPLPPYIKRSLDAQNSEDRERYQTTYAQDLGSVAAPTAGLHFTKEIDQKLLDAGCDFAYCTLHVGGGTFLPVKSENINAHDMHSESYVLSKDNLNKMISAKKEGRPILCVGTTSFRAVESFFLECEDRFDEALENADKLQQTSLFVRPPERDIKVKPFMTDYLLTNFHQPESTLFMLIAALVGLDEAQKMYQTATSNKYRLFSYGDANLLDLSSQ